MIADSGIARRTVLKALAMMPLLPSANESQAQHRIMGLGDCPAYAVEVALAVRGWSPSMRSALYQLGDRCLTILSRNASPRITAQLNSMAREDFIAGRVVLAGGWLVALTEAAVFTRLDAVLD